MPALDSSPPDDQGRTKTFQWSFSFGAKPHEVHQALAAARTAGAEPEVKEYVWHCDPISLADSLAENLAEAERRDPLRPVRRVLRWMSTVIFLALVVGGIMVGFWDATLGPYWGGIFGAVLGGLFYKMTQPYGWRNR